MEPMEEMEEGALEEMMKPKFQTHIYPDSLVMIRGDDDYIRTHAKALSKEANTKWDVDNLNRRLENWNGNNDITLFRACNNNPDLGLPNVLENHKLPITRFFQEHSTEVFEIDCSRH